MLESEEYRQLSATDIGRLVARGGLSAADVIHSCLERLSRVDPWLHAFTEVWPDQAERRSAALDDSADSTLPLAGVPIGVKAWDGLSSFAAQSLVHAGCIPVGLTSVPKGTEWQTWGWTDSGPTANPWCPSRVPGGSSAGSAAAVAAGIVPLATASDGAGSTRIPAAWCGIVGVKPTNGVLPTRDPTGLNVPGVMARSVADVVLGLAALMHDIDAIRRELSPDVLPSPAIWSPDLGFADCDQEVADVAHQAVEKLVAVGRIKRLASSVDLRDPWPVWMAIRSGQGESRQLRATREYNSKRLEELFSQADFLMTPTTPNRPHPHSGPGQTMSVSLTVIFNLTGHPCVSVPAGFTPDGLPVGLQIVGAHHTEQKILNLARALEAANPWSFPGAA